MRPRDVLACSCVAQARIARLTSRVHVWIGWRCSCGGASSGHCPPAASCSCDRQLPGAGPPLIVTVPVGPNQLGAARRINVPALHSRRHDAPPTPGTGDKPHDGPGLARAGALSTNLRTLTLAGSSNSKYLRLLHRLHAGLPSRPQAAARASYCRAAHAPAARSLAAAEAALLPPPRRRTLGSTAALPRALCRGQLQPLPAHPWLAQAGRSHNTCPRFQAFELLGP
jgi:hypothetical protein